MQELSELALQYFQKLKLLKSRVYKKYNNFLNIDFPLAEPMGEEDFTILIQLSSCFSSEALCIWGLKKKKILWAGREKYPPKNNLEVINIS